MQVISPLQMAPKHTAEVLSGVAEARTGVMCCREKTHLLEELPSGLSLRDVGKSSMLMH